MTDKQIIIYKKECYNEPHCSLNQVLEQLKAKEQECEELKIYIESNEQQVKEVETLVMDNDRLINELDQLKEQLEAYKMEAEEGIEINAELKAELTRTNCQIADDEILQCDMREAIEAIKAENKHLNDLLNQALKELEKTRETLTEIKKIAEHCINKDMCTFCDYSDKCYIEDEEIPTYDVCKLILQKISECEGNNVRS